MLIAHFKLNGDTTDSTGTYSSNTPTAINYTSDGKLDGAAVFNGTSSSILLGSTINLAGNTNWTVSVWVKTTSTTRMSILSNSSGGPVANDICIENGKIAYHHYNGSWLVKQGTTTINDGRWHNLIWVNFQSNKMNMYVDGVLELSMVDSTQSTGPVNQIGKNWSTAYFNGTMDDLRIYNDSNLSKITDLSFTKEMIAHWPLTSDLSDYSGNSNSLVNASGTSTLVTDGKIGGAHTKTSGYYNTGITKVPDEVTISMWFRHNGTDWGSECLFGTRVGSDGFMFYRNGGDTGGYYRIYFWYNNTAGGVVGYNTWPGIGGLLADTWYHITMVRNSNGNLKFYKDGIIAYDGTAPSDFSSWHNNGAQLSIHSQGNGSAYGDGNISFNDIRIYNYALSEYEVKELAKAKILHYTFDDPYEEPTTNLIYGDNGINSYPNFGNTHGTFNVNQYNNNTHFSIGTIGNITNNIVTLSSVGTPIYTYDVLNPQTTGGGVTAGTSYFIKKLSDTQFTLHEYNGSQDGSQGYINPATGNYKVYDSIANDVRIPISASGFPTMWYGYAHMANSSLVKEIIPNTIGTETETFHGHSFIRCHTGHKSGTVGDYMAYGVYPPVTSGLKYTFSFWYRASDVESIGATFTHTAYTTFGWPSSSGTLTATAAWKKAEWTATAPGTGGTNMYWSGLVNGKSIDISEIQVEQKASATPFSLLSRPSGVIDLSGYKNHGTVSSVTDSPRWVTDSKVGSGSVYFNGTTPHIISGLTNLGGLTTVTISFWRKNDTSITHWLPFVGQTLSHYIMATSSGTGGFYHAAIGSSWEIFKDGVAQGPLVAATPFTDQLWHHYAIRGVDLSSWTQFKISGYDATWSMEGYIDDLRIYNTNLSDSDILALYNRKANLDNLGNVQVGEIDLLDSYFPPLIDYSTWVVGNSSATGWSRNGTSAENIILINDNPVNKADIMWATLSNDATSNDDGGFDSTTGIIDKTKKYRYSIWIKRENLGDGRTYFGCGGSTVSNLGATEVVNGNPYFVNYRPSEKSNIGTQWVLIVAHVHPAGYTGGIDPMSGIYDVRGNKISSIATDYKWLTTSTNGSIRAYLFYSTSTTERQYLYRPRIDMIDGNEPSLEELINCTDNPVLYGRTLADINKKALFNANSQAVFRAIDEVSGTKNSAAQHEITNTGTLIINGEFSEVD